jgi:hypothetical protein
LAQDAELRQPQPFDGDVINTAEAIPPLSAEEEQRVAELKAAAEESLKPEAANARRAWAAEYATKHGLSEDDAAHLAAEAVDRRSLVPEFILQFDDLGTCTVADVLADPEKYVGETLADPLEGPAYGWCKAKVFRRADRLLMINSYAHGDTKYELLGQGVGLTDFYAYMEKHNYIYSPLGQPWPAASVNARIPPVPLVDAKGQPILDDKGDQKLLPAAAWLDRYRPVEQITWAPGLPMVIENRLISEGGWIGRNAARCFNLYKPPTIKLGDGGAVDMWYEHLSRLYPEDFEHIVMWMAHRVQHPGEKVNHALVLGGAQGIGKDSLLEPLKYAVGPWNFSEVSPKQAMGRFNGFLKSVVLRVNEARDLGEFDRYAFYDHMKAYTAAPPDVLRVDEKNLREHSILNCCGVIITTNHKTHGIYLPKDDRRHYVAWSECTKEDFDKDYWSRFWRWYREGGINNVAAHLNQIDIDDFDPKALPPKTDAFWAIVDAGDAPEDAEIADAIDTMAELGLPTNALTLDDISRITKSDDFREWLGDRKNRRIIPHRMEACGYVPARNDDAKDGKWVINGKRRVIYVKKTLSRQEQQAAARRRAAWSEDDEMSAGSSSRKVGGFRYRGN